MFKKRIIATCVTIFALGVVFAILFKKYDTSSFRALFVALAFVSTAVFCLSRFNNGVNLSKNISAAALAVAAFSFGVLRVSLYNINAMQTAEFSGCEDTVVVKVVEINENYVDATVLESKVGVSAQTKIRIYPENECDFMIGDTFCADVKYKNSYKPNLYANDIKLTASAAVGSVETGNGFLYTVRKFVSDNAEELFGDFYSAPVISKAITTGDRSGLDSYMYSVYKSGGVSHVLSISGLHISLIAMALHRFLASISVGKRTSSIISIIVTFVYTALVGFISTALRSAIMITFLLVSGMRHRRSDGITSLSVALFLLLILNPYSLYSAGLQLSFLCCLGILLVNPFLDKIDCYICEKNDSPRRKAALPYRILYAMASPLIVSFAASVFSFPVLCTRFDTISYVSPLANIIIVPLFSYATGITLVAYLIAPLSMTIASVVAFPAGFLFEASTWINAFLYENDIGVTSVHTQLMYIPFVLSVAIILLLVFKRRNRIKYGTIAAAVFAVTLGICCMLTEYLIKDKVVVEYSDDTSEYLYFQTANKNVYFDINGYTSYPDAVFENGKTALDEYVLIEYTEYAYKRFDYISGNLKIHSVYAPKPKNFYEMDLYSRIKELANARNCDIIEYDNIYSNEELGNSKLYMLKNDMLSDTFILAFEHNEISMRFIGDGYESPVNSDYAVLLGRYEHGSYLISSDNRFVKESVKTSNQYIGFSTYSNTIRFVGNVSEGDFKVYES